MMSETRQIFDRQRERQQRLRALARPNYPDFLDELIAKELASRLDLIERRFDKCLVMGPTAGRFLAVIEHLEKLDTIITADNVAFDSEWLPFKDNSLDCIIAAPGLELVNDLPGALIQINRALKPDGLFLAALYGGNTLVELRHVWLMADEQLRGGTALRVAPFIDVRQAGNLLQRAGFALPVADMDTLNVRYDTAGDLMAEIKNMGFGNCLTGRSRKFVSGEMMALVNSHYSDLFSDDDGRVRASVEINYLTGWCPHESQQKPLKPGSAQKRLADILTKDSKAD